MQTVQTPGLEGGKAVRANQSGRAILPTSLPAKESTANFLISFFFVVHSLFFYHDDNLTALPFWLFAPYCTVTGQPINKEKRRVVVAVVIVARPPKHRRPSTDPQVSSFACVCPCLPLNSVKLDYFLVAPFQPPLLYLFLSLSLYTFFSLHSVISTALSLFTPKASKASSSLLLHRLYRPSFTTDSSFFDSLFTHSFPPQHNFIPSRKIPSSTILKLSAFLHNFPTTIQPQLCNLIHVYSNLTLCKIQDAYHALSNASPRGGIASPFS